MKDVDANLDLVICCILVQTKLEKNAFKLRKLFWGEK